MTGAAPRDLAGGVLAGDGRRGGAGRLPAGGRDRCAGGEVPVSAAAVGATTVSVPPAALAPLLFGQRSPVEPARLDQDMRTGPPALRAPVPARPSHPWEPSG